MQERPTYPRVRILMITNYLELICEAMENGGLVELDRNGITERCSSPWPSSTAMLWQAVLGAYRKRALRCSWAYRANRPSYFLSNRSISLHASSSETFSGYTFFEVSRS